jgi:hypothetical protein
MIPAYVLVKEAFGHSRIEATLVYSHVAKIDPVNRFGYLYNSFSLTFRKSSNF